MEQFFRFAGLAFVGGTIGVMFAQGLVALAIPLCVGMFSYMVYANWNR